MKFKKHRLVALCQPQASGFTLMESLMAIVVLSILLVGVAPIIVLSTATRVQARRVELATQAARAYIDGVRSGSIAVPNAVKVIDEVDSNNKFDPKRTDFAAVAAPGTANLTTCTSSTTGYPYCPNPSSLSTTEVSLYCFDRDGDNACTRGSNSDLIVQAYRSVTDSSTTAPNPQDQLDNGYLLGVRVYRANAFQGTQALKRDSVQKSYGSSLDPKLPLIQITTEIPSKSFGGFCERVGGGDC